MIKSPLFCYDVFMNVHAIRLHTAAFLLGCGYLAVILGWLWWIILWLPPLIEDGKFEFLIPDPYAAQIEERQPFRAEMTPIAGIVVSFMTIVMLIVTFVVLWKIPKTVAKTGEKVVAKSVESVLPVILHHKPIPKKQKRQLSRRVAYAIQLFSILLPFALLHLLPQVEGISTDVIIAIGAGLACAGTALFTLAFLIDAPVPPTSRTRSPASHE